MINKIDYKYNQILWNGRILVKFIYFREDINKVICEHDNKIFQLNVNKLIPATIKQIDNYYENKINKLKKNNVMIKKRIIKPNYKLLRENIELINLNLKELKFTIYNLKFMNKITNSKNDNTRSLSIKASHMKRNKSNIIDKFFYDNKNYKQTKDKLKTQCLLISKLKEERNKMLKSQFYLQGECKWKIN